MLFRVRGGSDPPRNDPEGKWGGARCNREVTHSPRVVELADQAPLVGKHSPRVVELADQAPLVGLKAPEVGL